MTLMVGWLVQFNVVQTIGSQEGCHGLCLYHLALPMMLGFSHSAFVSAKNLVASVAVVNVSVWLLVTFSYFGPPLELRTWSSSTMRGKRWRLARRRESKSFATVTSISLQVVLPRAPPRSIFHDSVMSQFQDKLGRPRYLTCSSCKLLIY